MLFCMNIQTSIWLPTFIVTIVRFLPTGMEWRNNGTVHIFLYSLILEMERDFLDEESVKDGAANKTSCSIINGMLLLGHWCMPAAALRCSADSGKVAVWVVHGRFGVGSSVGRGWFMGRRWWVLVAVPYTHLPSPPWSFFCKRGKSLVAHWSLNRFKPTLLLKGGDWAILQTTFQSSCDPYSGALSGVFVGWCLSHNNF